MTEPRSERPARRFLHICYCCADDAGVGAFLVDGLDMKRVMRTTDEYSSGDILGITSDIRAPATFVYDRRGPRSSPAIEVQGWYDPALVGEPATDPFQAGIRALGFAVPEVETTLARLMSMGCTVVADGESPFDARHVTVLDPRNVTLELVEDSSIPAGESRIHHLRITVLDLEKSLAFYDSLGFDQIDRGTLTDAAFTGHAGEVDAEYAVLRLPDEPTAIRIVQWRSPVGHGTNYAEPFHAGIYRAALGVDDTRASYDRLREAGATFDRPPMEIVMAGTPVPGMWITFITDPDGIPWEFVQRPRSIFR